MSAAAEELAAVLEVAHANLTELEQLTPDERRHAIAAGPRPGPRRPTGPELLMSCWCDTRERLVPRDDVLHGRGWSCNPLCVPPQPRHLRVVR
jgi:hypothetical protein